MKKKSIKTIVATWVAIILIGSNTSSDTICSTISFNKPFPETWYTKGLHSTIFVWHRMCRTIKKNTEFNYAKELDILIGKIAFAHFCLKKMHTNKQILINEDRDYFIALLQRIKSCLTCEEIDDEFRDQCNCLEDMINRMQCQLEIPCNI